MCGDEGAHWGKDNACKARRRAVARLGGLTSGTSWGKLMTDLRSAHVSVGGESMQTLSASPTLPPGAKAGAGFAVLIANPYSQRAKSDIQLGTRGCGLIAV